MHSDEIQLLQQAKRGNLGAFSDLVKLHQNAIRAYLRVRLSSKDEADDLAQDVFVTAFHKLDQLENQPFGAWLRRIALNHLRNYQRKFRPAPAGDNHDLQEILEHQIPQHLPENAESDSLGALRECMDTLDGPSATLVRERYLTGRTVREIAARTERGYSALTMQLHRIRTLLGDCIRTKVSNPSAR